MAYFRSAVLVRGERSKCFMGFLLDLLYRFFKCLRTRGGVSGNEAYVGECNEVFGDVVNILCTRILIRFASGLHSAEFRAA